MYLKPAPCRALESVPIGRSLRGAERLPMREFKGMSGAPKSLCYVWQGRTWDRLTGPSHVPYGDTGLVVVVGVTPHQGGRENRPQSGEGGQVIGHSKAGRSAGCGRPQMYWMSCVNAEGAACRWNDCIGNCLTRSCICSPTGVCTPTRGAMTPGPDGETVDGMSLAKIGRVIDALRHERYRFKPVRRTYIPKKNGTKRPLGLPSWSDKLVGEVVRLLLEAYYEPQFSDRSHGYRPERGCHTALSEVVNRWPGTTWFIEGDVSDCFGSLDHDIMLSTLAGNIHDGRFLRLLRNMLQAGYLEDWVWHATLSGAPQGGVASPILSNIYLDRLDSYVENVLIPEYTRGTGRAPNPDYQEVEKQLMRARRRGDRPAVRALRKQRRCLPSKDPNDPGFRRLRYVRYCTLCRRRHKSHYADLGIMPMRRPSVLVTALPSLDMSA